MYKVLVTGGVGSGKSTVCKMFENLSVPVFYSDEAAKKLMDNNPFIMMNIKKSFGDDIYVKKYDKKRVAVKEELDRKKLADIVFNDDEKLDKLNKIVHPWVGGAFESFCFEYEYYDFKYPDIVSSPSKNIRAQWRTRPNRHFAVEFFPTGDAHFVIFSPDSSHPEKTKRLSGITSIETLLETVKPQGVLAWSRNEK